MNEKARVMRDQVGKWIPEGLAVGITGNLKPLEKATMKMGLAAIPNVPNLSNVNIPQSAQNGIYGNQSNYTSNFSPTINIQSNNPFETAQQQDRLIRRLRFQGGISR